MRDPILAAMSGRPRGSPFVARCPGYVIVPRCVQIDYGPATHIIETAVRCGYPRRFEEAGRRECRSCGLRFDGYVDANGVVHADTGW